MSDEIEMTEAEPGQWMTREEAVRKGCNLWHIEGYSEKNAPFWGSEGPWPLLTIAIVLWFIQILVPIIHSGVSRLLGVIGLQ